jgi:hypothetical protein
MARLVGIEPMTLGFGGPKIAIDKHYIYSRHYLYWHNLGTLTAQLELSNDKCQPIRDVGHNVVQLGQ